MASATVPDATPRRCWFRSRPWIPAKYPYYGEVKLDPPMPLAQALTPDTVVGGRRSVDPPAREGRPDMVRVGGQDFRVAAAVDLRAGPHVGQPEHRAAPDDVARGVRAHRTDADRQPRGGAVSVQAGSRRAAGGTTCARAIKSALPEAVVADFRQSHPIITSGLDRATVFLSLVSLIALIVGAIGVGMAMHAHLQQKMDHIAVMKSLGATSSEIIRIYTIADADAGPGGRTGGRAGGPRRGAGVSRC